MMRKLLNISLVCMCLLTSCRSGSDRLDLEEGIQVFYLNANGDGLVSESYIPEGYSSEQQIEELIQELEKAPDSIEKNSVFQKTVRVKSWEMEETKLKLDFGEEYCTQDKVSEVLLRSAVVKTLSQIHGVDYVGFYVEGQPLETAEGEIPGYMNEEDFVQNIGASLEQYEEVELTVYFGDKNGEGLLKERIKVGYNGNESQEKLVVKQLIKGPKSEEMLPVIPREAELLGVTIKEDICYVNFDEGFMAAVQGITPKTTIYSLVNSVIDVGNVSKVQILVNGDSSIIYREQIDLNKPLSKEDDFQN